MKKDKKISRITSLNFVFNNLKRNKLRTLFTILSVVFASITLFIVLSLNNGYKSSIENELIESTGVHLYITREGCPMEAASIIAQGGISPFFVSQDIINKVNKISGIEEILPFKIFAITTDDGPRTDIFMGITESIIAMRRDWIIVEGDWFADEDSIILGAEIAQIEKRQIGDKVYFEFFDREFTVTGILKRSFSQDDGMFFLPLDTAQKMLGREDKLSAIAIRLKDLNEMEAVRNTIRGMLEDDYFVITSKDLSDGVLSFFASTKIMMFIMVLIALTMSIFGLINTILMTINERKREIAYLKCIGAGATDIIKFVLFEVIIICCIGYLIGILIGYITSPIFEQFIRSFLVVYVPASKIVRPNLFLVFISFITIITVGIITTLPPILKAGSIKPMELLRNE